VTLIVGTGARGAGTLEYSLPAAGDVRITLYDVAGHQVATLENTTRGAGSHQLSWNHSRLVSGMYFCRMQAGAVTVAKPVLILR